MVYFSRIGAGWRGLGQVRKHTRYFDQIVLPKRPYLSPDAFEAIASAPRRQERQPDGRIRCWGYVASDGHFWRVVLEPDGTLHNAFRDRDFRP